MSVCAASLARLLFDAPAFSPCGEWISSRQQGHVACSKFMTCRTGAVKHSFGDEGDDQRCTHSMVTLWNTAVDVLQEQGFAGVGHCNRCCCA